MSINGIVRGGIVDGGGLHDNGIKNFGRFNFKWIGRVNSRKNNIKKCKQKAIKSN